MTTESLNEFLLLSKLQSFTTAADELFISQSTLSRHVMALEKELGVQLFERTTNHVKLTDAGNRLIKYAKQIVSTQNTFYSELSKLGLAAAPALKIGHDRNIRYYGISGILGQFILEHPSLNISLVENHSEKLLSEIEAGNLDAAFVFQLSNGPFRPKSDNFKTVPISTDVLALLAPLNHPLGNRSVVSFGDLANETFTFSSKRPAITSLCLEECKKAGFIPNCVYDTFGSEIAFEFVAQGKCISIGWKVPMKVLYGDKLSIIELDSQARRNVILVYNRSNETSAALLQHLVGSVMNSPYRTIQEEL